MTALKLAIDRSSAVPLYHQVVRGIEAAIRNGDLSAGSRLDNEIDLAAQMNLSRPTMRKAMDELVRSGLLVRRRGVGTQVVSNEVRRSPEITSLFEDLQEAGGIPTSEVLAFSREPAYGTVAESLHTPPGTYVYHSFRLRRVDGRPLALMENWIREDAVELSEALLSSRGLYEILRAAGVNLRLAHQRIGARIADDAEADRLDIAPGSALVTMLRVAIDDKGRSVELGRHLYRADSHSFEMTLVNR